MRTKILRLRAESEVEHRPSFPELSSEDAVTVYTDHSYLKLDPDLVRRLVFQVAEQEGQKIQHLEIVLTGTERLRGLNEAWRNADYDTDVLSFSLSEGPVLDAVVYVSLDFAQTYCQDYEATFIQEASRYVVHGLLHLLGYEDSTLESRQIMRQREDDYLRRAGLIDT